MRTARFLTVMGGGVYRVCVCVSRGCDGGVFSPDPEPDTPPHTHTHLWTEWLTDRCKNITFPQLRLRAVKILNVKKKLIYHFLHYYNGMTGNYGRTVSWWLTFFTVSK